MSENLNKTFGALFIGAIVGAIVYGITTLQTYFYFLHCTQDGLDLKILVAIVWLLDTVHVGLVCHSLYYYLVTGYGVSEILLSGTWSLFTSIAVNVTIAFVSQCFFIKHIHSLSTPRFRWLLSSIITFIVVAHFVFGIETVVQFSVKKEFARLHETNYTSVIPFGVAAVLSDIMIAAALVILLRESRSEFEDTNSLIKKLIVYSVNRCVLTSVVAVVEVILFIAVPGSLLTFAFDFVIGKLYANSLLASLNSRKSLHVRSRKRGAGVRSSLMSTGFNIASLTEIDTHLSSMSQIDSQSPEDDRQIWNDRKTRSSAITGNSSSHKRRRSLPTMAV